MHHITTPDNTRLYFKDWGAGRPVILIHGWPLSADSWDDQALAIAEAGHRVIAYDRRGFGRSSQPWSGYDYNTLSDDLAEVIRQTGATDATLIGFSMGGGEVARYMSRHNGQSVIKAALVSSVLPFRLQTADNPGGTEQGAFDQTAQALRDDRARFFTGFFEKLVAEPAEPEDPAPARGPSDPLGAGFDYAAAFQTLDLDAWSADLHRVDDRFPALVAGRLRPLRPAVRAHGLAQPPAPTASPTAAAARAMARSALRR
jgi:non-heme chloroperoxidase